MALKLLKEKLVRHCFNIIAVFASKPLRPGGTTVPVYGSSGVESGLTETLGCFLPRTVYIECEEGVSMHDPTKIGEVRKG